MKQCTRASVDEIGRRPRIGRKLRAGFTMVELLLALGLLSILIVALIRLLDTSMTIWNRTEASRDLQEMSSAVIELMVDDVSAIEGGPRGDLLGDWARFDVDRDGQLGALYPRFRFVRQAGAADLLRVTPELASGVGETMDAEKRYQRIDPRDKGLIETAWCVLPASGATPDARPLGVLYRGERRLHEDSLSFFDPRFFSATGKPTPGSLEFVTGGVLWLDLWYAAQTSILHDGWSIGDQLSDCATSWDARNLNRPDLEVTFLNTPAAGMPRFKKLPLLPRRILLTLEIERPSELKHRTRLAAALDAESLEVSVDDERKLTGVGAMILIDEEWMQVRNVSSGVVVVLRAQRGSRAATHEAGTLIHWGNPIRREIPIPAMREDWDL